jgi:hypothetical protein
MGRSVTRRLHELRPQGRRGGSCPLTVPGEIPATQGRSAREAGWRRVKHERTHAIDLFCGLGGWTDGLLAEGYDVIGFDIERHEYGEHRYPAQLVLQDVLTLHGSQFRSAALIVASPPCQAYSYRAMPWKRAKALPPPDNTLFEACFRIQREACAAAGRHIPLIVENVRGPSPEMGRARPLELRLVLPVGRCAGADAVAHLVGGEYSSDGR